MKFDAHLTTRTESSAQPGVVILEFTPITVGVPRLTMAVPPAEGHSLVMQGLYRFEATLLEGAEPPAS